MTSPPCSASSSHRNGPPRAGNLAIEVTCEPDSALVVLSGELDLVTTPQLSERLSTILRKRPRRLVLDMAGIGFMDCGSARLIVSTGKFLPAGTRPVIRAPSAPVRRILELTGLDDACDVEE